MTTCLCSYWILWLFWPCPEAVTISNTYCIQIQNNAGRESERVVDVSRQRGFGDGKTNWNSCGGCGVIEWVWVAFYQLGKIMSKTLSWVKRNGSSPVWMVKMWEKLVPKTGQQSANGPVWMSQAQKPQCLIQFWWIPFSPILPSSLWDNKNWPPVWKWKSCKIWKIKLPQQGANGPVWMPQALKILCLAQVGWNQFSNFQPSSPWKPQALKIICRHSKSSA